MNDLERAYKRMSNMAFCNTTDQKYNIDEYLDDEAEIKSAIKQVKLKTAVRFKSYFEVMFAVIMVFFLMFILGEMELHVVFFSIFSHSGFLLVYIYTLKINESEL